MVRALTTAVRAAVVTALLTGVLYPLAVHAIARGLFPEKAGGSLIRDAEGRVIGSELIAQRFTAPWYFHPRPSAAGGGYDAARSGGSNLGPTSRTLRDRAALEAQKLLAENPDAPSRLVPVELVTASGSGLDPHISIDAARWQAPRVAKARDVEPARVEQIIEGLAEGRTLGFLGEPRVNVLLLNLELDRALGRAKAGKP
jgi:K+-transporting ATPase ATPase C chain